MNATGHDAADIINIDNVDIRLDIDFDVTFPAPDDRE